MGARDGCVSGPWVQDGLLWCPVGSWGCRATGARGLTVASLSALCSATYACPAVHPRYKALSANQGPAGLGLHGMTKVRGIPCTHPQGGCSRDIPGAGPIPKFSSGAGERAWSPRPPPCPRQAPGVFTLQCCVSLGATLGTGGRETGYQWGGLPRNPVASGSQGSV